MTHHTSPARTQTEPGIRAIDHLPVATAGRPECPGEPIHGTGKVRTFPDCPDIEDALKPFPADPHCLGNWQHHDASQPIVEHGPVICVISLNLSEWLTVSRVPY